MYSRYRGTFFLCHSWVKYKEGIFLDLYVIITMIFNKLSGGIIMDDLAKQVKHDMLRTLIWVTIALGAATAVVYIVW